MFEVEWEKQKNKLDFSVSLKEMWECFARFRVVEKFVEKREDSTLAEPSFSFLHAVAVFLCVCISSKQQQRKDTHPPHRIGSIFGFSQSIHFSGSFRKSITFFLLYIRIGIQNHFWILVWFYRYNRSRNLYFYIIYYQLEIYIRIP